MWKSGFCLSVAITFFSTWNMLKKITFSQRVWKSFHRPVIHRKVFHDPQALWIKLKAGIDICCNIPNVILQIFVSALERRFHLFDGVQNGGVILTKFLTDIRCGEIGQLADQIDRYLSCFCSAFILQCAPEYRFFNGIEFTYLVDDQTGGGKGIAFIFKHIVDGAGNVGKIQGHIIQIPVSHDLFHCAFDLPDVVGYIYGNVITDFVTEVQS